jgi:hypothetical protein
MTTLASRLPLRPALRLDPATAVAVVLGAILVSAVSASNGGFAATSWGWVTIALAWLGVLTLVLHSDISVGRLEVVTALAARRLRGRHVPRSLGPEPKPCDAGAKRAQPLPRDARRARRAGSALPRCRAHHPARRSGARAFRAGRRRGRRARTSPPLSMPRSTGTGSCPGVVLAPLLLGAALLLAARQAWGVAGFGPSAESLPAPPSCSWPSSPPSRSPATRRWRTRAPQRENRAGTRRAPEPAKGPREEPARLAAVARSRACERGQSPRRGCAARPRTEPAQHRDQADRDVPRNSRVRESPRAPVLVGA